MNLPDWLIWCFANAEMLSYGVVLVVVLVIWVTVVMIKQKGKKS